MTIVRYVFPIMWFVILYIVAFISNRSDPESDDVLFVSRSQWRAIFVLMLPILLAIFER